MSALITTSSFRPRATRSGQSPGPTSRKERNGVCRCVLQPRTPERRNCLALRLCAVQESLLLRQSWACNCWTCLYGATMFDADAWWNQHQPYSPRLKRHVLRALGERNWRSTPSHRPSPGRRVHRERIWCPVRRRRTCRAAGLFMTRQVSSRLSGLSEVLRAAPRERGPRVDHKGAGATFIADCEPAAAADRQRASRRPALFAEFASGSAKPIRAPHSARALKIAGAAMPGLLRRRANPIAGLGDD